MAASARIPLCRRGRLLSRTLRERDEHSTFQVTWVVLSVEFRPVAAVTCESDGASGVSGVREPMFAPLDLRRIYGRVLEQLDQLAS